MFDTSLTSIQINLQILRCKDKFIIHVQLFLCVKLIDMVFPFTCSYMCLHRYTRTSAMFTTSCLLRCLCHLYFACEYQAPVSVVYQSGARARADTCRYRTRTSRQMSSTAGRRSTHWRTTTCPTAPSWRSLTSVTRRRACDRCTGGWR